MGQDNPLDEQKRLGFLSYLAPALFLGAMCWGFFFYGWQQNKSADPLQAGKSGQTPLPQVLSLKAPSATATTEPFGRLAQPSQGEAPQATGENWRVGVFEPPIFLPEGRQLQRPYGLSFSPTYRDYRFHTGLDFAANFNEDALNAAPGQVKEIAYRDKDKYTVVVSHSGGWESRYSHLTLVKVKLGETLGLGQILGSIAEPGYEEMAEGAHLHWELWQNGERRNPGDHLRVPRPISEPGSQEALADPCQKP